ncbi:uncharacterized protein LOC129572810 [Sitodiplosis mosellana]|uniref:uncharacterized protein LOC129572810 n=1 Tax=Sitodiplosis mosellana TaxID=263140 RepID=UPI002444C50F|nr:uncharacterized protein LOC129572810 [Sitodiplosis mosellana]
MPNSGSGDEDETQISGELADQKIRLEKLKDFCVNYTKDGKDRKNKVEYFERRLQLLAEWRNTFEKAHNDLIANEADKENAYFAKNHHEKAFTKCDEMHDTITKDLETFKAKQTKTKKSSTTGASTSKAGAPIPSPRENENPKKIHIVEFLDSDDEETIEDQLDIESQEEVPPTVAVLRYQTKELYDVVKMIQKNEPSTQGEANAQLEQLKTVWAELRATYRQLPEFNGEKDDWREFKDLFGKIIHDNNSISDALKVQYLKSCLKGETLKKIKYLTPEESNYQDVYNVLERRYGNKRENVGKLIDKILELPNQTVETSSSLRNIYDVTYECMMAIRNFDVNTENWDPLVIHILKKKLSKTTLIDYESKLVDIRELQQLSDFLNYIEHRFMALLSAEVKERSEWAKSEKVCVICIQKHDGECKAKFNTCKTCGKKHNTLLHFETKKEANEKKTTLLTTTTINEATSSKSNETSQVQVLTTTKNTNKLLATAFVNVLSKNGEKVLLKSVIDGASQGALITENAFQKLGLDSDSVNAEVQGVEGRKSTAGKMTNLTLRPHFSDDYELETEALVMKKITNLSYFKDDLKRYDYLQNLLYADPTINDENEIDLLLDVAAFTAIIKNGLIKGPIDAPIAVNNLECVNSDESETEPSDEERCREEYYVKTTKRDDDGRLNVSMAFTTENGPCLGDSRKIALATLFQLEKKFAKNPEFHKQYVATINESIELGHLVLEKNPPIDSHYIPHHAVFKNSTTTKLRQVYNASNKTANGKSLNEQLVVGKIDQSSIFELIMRWREPKIAVIADLEKMYKQIRLNENQQHLQMILWRESCDEPIKSYKMTTVTFGLKDAPYLAIRSLHEIAQRVKEKYPRAAKAILKCFYVDDYSGGAETVDEALSILREMKQAFDEYGFNLRKIVSNSPELLEAIPECDKEQNVSIVKVLGIPWNPKNDEFVFNIKLNIHERPRTKRQLASEIATVQYDPLGWIAPVIVKAKILLQNVWKLKHENNKPYAWDDDLPIEIVNEWMSYKSRLSVVNSIVIPRWLGTATKMKVELHGFSDACAKAISANVYIRFASEESIRVVLIAAKTKLAPINE